MAMKVLVIVLLGLVCNGAISSPVPNCGSIPPPPPSCGSNPVPPEVYEQNNGEPLIVNANEVAVPDLPDSPCAPSPPVPEPCSPAASAGVPVFVAPPPPPPPCALAPAPPSGPSPYGPGPLPPNVSPDDVKEAQEIADQADQEHQAETIPADHLPPCKVEKYTDVVKHPAETYVHHPGPIYINQPPTRLVINHAPFVIHPSPVVLNHGGKTVTKEVTKKILPGSLQVKPIIVRLVKPYTKNVLIEKPHDNRPHESFVVTERTPDICHGVRQDVPPSAPPSGSYPGGYPVGSVPLPYIPGGPLLPVGPGPVVIPGGPIVPVGPAPCLSPFGNEVPIEIVPEAPAAPAGCGCAQ